MLCFNFIYIYIYIYVLEMIAPNLEPNFLPNKKRPQIVINDWFFKVCYGLKNQSMIFWRSQKLWGLNPNLILLWTQKCSIQIEILWIFWIITDDRFALIIWNFNFYKLVSHKVHCQHKLVSLSLATHQIIMTHH